MNVTYIRYQDDLLVLCKTKRQMNRARRRMMQILHERQLSLSSKKSRMGSIESGFHFLGINYLPTRMEDNTHITHANDEVITETTSGHYLSDRGGKSVVKHHLHEPTTIVPHARTLRKAREQIRLMVFDGLSAKRIRNYLRRWVMWWQNTSTTWEYQELLQHFIDVCLIKRVANYAIALLRAPSMAQF